VQPDIDKPLFTTRHLRPVYCGGFALDAQADHTWLHIQHFKIQTCPSIGRLIAFASSFDLDFIDSIA
jgi:hypothetical protein